ncbi:MAG: WD40 repeat domain-containing protein, partial [Acidimicrobiia bacterium]
MAGIGVLAAVALATLRLPSALEESEPANVADRLTPTPTTTWVFEPPPRTVWQPPAGTWVGLIRSSGPEIEPLLGSQLAFEPPPGAIDVLPDGSYLALDGTSLAVYGKESQFELGHARADTVALSPNGRLLAFLNSEGQLEIWDLAARMSLEAVALPAPGQVVTWSPDSKLVGLSFEVGYGVWDLRTAALRALGQTGELVAVSPDSLAVWTEERLELRDLDGGLLRSWEALANSASVVGAFDPTGRYLALTAQARPPERDDEQVTEPEVPGLWMVSVFGTAEVRLGDAGPFTWS